MKENCGVLPATCHSPYWRYLYFRSIDMEVSCIACGSDILLGKLRTQCIVKILQPSEIPVYCLLSLHQTILTTLGRWFSSCVPKWENSKMKYTDKIKRNHWRTKCEQEANISLCNLHNKKKYLCVLLSHGSPLNFNGRHGIFQDLASLRKVVCSLWNIPAHVYRL